MSSVDDSVPVILNYFVDESGDPTLFARRRRSIVGQKGCSNYFMLGKLEVDDPDRLHQELETLRSELLTDPYFRNVPSMQPAEEKTAVMFHAKDDLPEVRYRVLKLLATQPVSFYAVVRDKHRLIEQVRARNRADPDYWYRENELYDELVQHLFKSRFHRGDHFEVCFAKRGTSDRTAALELALDQARRTYEQTWGCRAGQRSESGPVHLVKTPGCKPWTTFSGHCSGCTNARRTASGRSSATKPSWSTTWTTHEQTLSGYTTRSPSH